MEEAAVVSKSKRSKRTLPKPCDDELTLEKEASASSDSQSVSDPEELMDEENFRRFSSRQRKKPAFFDSSEDKGQSSGRKRRKGGCSVARRRLKFDLKLVESKGEVSDAAHLQIASAPLQLGGCGSDVCGGARERFPLGMMVWGKLQSYNWWPGVVISHSSKGTRPLMAEPKDKPNQVPEVSSLTCEVEGGGGGGGGQGSPEGTAPAEPGQGSSEPQLWVKWFGDNQLSQVHAHTCVLYSVLFLATKRSHVPVWFMMPSLSACVLACMCYLHGLSVHCALTACVSVYTVACLM